MVKTLVNMIRVTFINKKQTHMHTKYKCLCIKILNMNRNPKVTNGNSRD